jgi:YesN/AraC family two-component response regulator
MKHLLLQVKNMVCHRCVLSVEKILESLKIPFHNVNIGEIQLCDKINEQDKLLLGEKLRSIGLELIDNRTGSMVEKIKQLVILKARNETVEKERRMKLSVYLSGKLNHEYSYLSSLFSDIEGRTIENYFIFQRIEKAKELIVYGQMNLSEIAIELDYSSVAHLSSQFKKVTGLTPSHFKEIGAAKRNTLDRI